jgi:hypothetical protein
VNILGAVLGWAYVRWLQVGLALVVAGDWTWRNTMGRLVAAGFNDWEREHHERP